MKLATASQMQNIDKAAIEGLGIPSLTLMENAGKGVTEVVQREFPETGPVSIVVGKGNNGGDGLVVARLLKKAGYQIYLFLCSPWTEFTPDARINWDKLAGLGIEVFEFESEKSINNHSELFRKSICIVDAIFGTGLTSEVKGKYKAIIEYLNSLVKPIVAVDIPSGLSADTGRPLGTAIRAKFTPTLGLGKVGLFIDSEYSRNVEIIDIGFPEELISKTRTGFFLSEPEIFENYFNERKPNSHKGDFGHVLTIAGSSGKIGAGLLSSRASLRSGAGLVTYALPDAAYKKFSEKAPEIMYEALPDERRGYLGKTSIAKMKTIISGKDVVALGPGIGTQEETKKVVFELLKRVPVPIVLDADGINCVESDFNVLSTRKYPTILTPHPGEMGRLFKKTTKEIQVDRIGIARKFAKEYGVYVVLKGNKTIIGTPEGDIYINPTGNPGMATAGMGDVLTGVIASFIAQKIPVLESVVAGVYIHGLAADIAVKNMGERGLIASDVIESLPKALNTLNP